MRISRRAALKGIVVAGGAVVGATPARAAVLPAVPADAAGLLYDATLCIGCKTCVVACRDSRGLPADTTGSLTGIYNAPVDLSAKARTVIKLYHEGSDTAFVKAQCMHCVDPACASAC